MYIKIFIILYFKLKIMIFIIMIYIWYILYKNRVKWFNKHILYKTKFWNILSKIFSNNINSYNIYMKYFSFLFLFIWSLWFVYTSYITYNKFSEIEIINQLSSKEQPLNFENLISINSLNYSWSYYVFMDWNLFAINQEESNKYINNNKIINKNEFKNKVIKWDIKIYPTDQEEIKKVKWDIIFLNNFNTEIKEALWIWIWSTYFNISDKWTDYLWLFSSLLNIVFFWVIWYFLYISLKKMWWDSWNTFKSSLINREDVNNLVEYWWNKHLLKTIEELIKLYKVNSKIDTVKWILLYGPPWTGKTLFWKYLSKKLNIPFYYLSAWQFRNKYYWWTWESVRNLFTKIRKELVTKKMSNAIIFLDELDSIWSKRTQSHEATWEWLNQLLTEIDWFKKEDWIIIIWATNLADNLDSALLSRFNLKHYVWLPNKDERKEILYNQLKYLYDNYTKDWYITLQWWFNK